MALNIPNYAAASFPQQAEPDSLDFSILAAGLAKSGVLTGGLLFAGGGMGLVIGAASISYAESAAINVSSASVTLAAADATNPRFDLLSYGTGGTPTVTTGTPAASPVYPALPANSVAGWVIYVPAGATSVTASNFTDKRAILASLPVKTPIAVKTAAHSITTLDEVIIANAATGPFTVTLPTAVGAKGTRYLIKRVNAGPNAVTVATTSSQTIDGSTTVTLSLQYEALSVISDDLNWQVT